MKRMMVKACAVLALAGGTAAGAQTVETGYPTGSLALAAIERGDWATAERLLNEDRGVARDNPARLINLGRVYMATGRAGEAVAAWRQALSERHPEEVVTAGGRTVTTAQLAREALAHYGGGMETAAR